MSSIPQLPQEIFDSLHPAAQFYIRYLEETVQAQAVRIQQLEERVRELANRLNKNSQQHANRRGMFGMP